MNCLQGSQGSGNERQVGSLAVDVPLRNGVGSGRGLGAYCSPSSERRSFSPADPNGDAHRSQPVDVAENYHPFQWHVGNQTNRVVLATERMDGNQLQVAIQVSIHCTSAYKNHDI